MGRRDGTNAGPRALTRIGARSFLRRAGANWQKRSGAERGRGGGRYRFFAVGRWEGRRESAARLIAAELMPGPPDRRSEHNAGAERLRYEERTECRQRGRR